MSRPAASFAIPGDIETLTGGYIYERRLLEGLRALGHDMTHLRLSASFPDPSPADMADAIAQMRAVPPDRPLIVDGLVFGAAEGLEAVQAPMVAMLHHPLALEEGLPEVRRAHLYRTERANVALAAHILVPSAHTRDVLVADYAADPGRITVAPPGVDRPRRAPARSTPPLILSVGILHPRKGHDVLLDALARIVSRDWRAVIVGSDYDSGHAQTLRARCAALGLEDRVSFAGQVPRDRLELMFCEASIFALATRYEGYGMVFAEALSHGLPIVATRGGAVPQTVPEGAGRLVAVDDAAAFADALEAVLTDNTLRGSLAAASRTAGLSLPRWDRPAQIASDALCGLVR